jgi:hypothetical protein
MDNESRYELSILGIGIIAGLFIGIICASFVVNTLWRIAAIEHKAAHYDSITAKFTWNDNKQIKGSK